MKTDRHLSIMLSLAVEESQLPSISKHIVRIINDPNCNTVATARDLPGADPVQAIFLEKYLSLAQTAHFLPIESRLRDKKRSDLATHFSHMH